MKGEYGKLRKRILLHVLVIAGVGLALWALLQFAFAGGFNQPQDITQMADGADPAELSGEGDLVLYEEQMEALTKVFDQRQSIYLATIGLLAVMLVIFYYAMMRLTKYFKETSEGVDELLLDDGGAIKLSPEMDFMAKKLNSVKQELVRRDAEARDAERRKNELVVYLAHDIRTPLTTVIGYLKLMSEEPDMPVEQRARYLGVTLESAKRLEALTDQLFEITRFNAQGIELERREFDLTVLLQQLADAFFPQLEPQGKRIELDVPAGLRITGDADKLARVFRNILKNAAVYSDANSVIRVNVANSDARVTVTITDTGSTIPKEALAAIFDKFCRLDNARSAKTGGAGLGLAIAKEIVLAHGGNIQAASNNGETVFTVRLPIKSEMDI